MPLPEADQQYPLEYMDAHSVIKLRENDAGVTVGICAPGNAPLLSSLREFHDKPVTFRCVERPELSAYLGKRLSRLAY